MHGEHLVVLVSTKNLAVWHRKLQTNEQRFHATNDEEHHGDNAVHDADLLMVNGEEPLAPALCCDGALHSTKSLLRSHNYWSSACSGSFDDRHVVLRLLQRQ